MAKHPKLIRIAEREVQQMMTMFKDGKEMVLWAIRIRCVVHNNFLLIALSS